MLTHLLGSQTDVEIKEEPISSGDIKGLSQAVGNCGADVVVEVRDNLEIMPPEYAFVFKFYPDVVILVLALHEKGGVVYRRTVNGKPMTVANANSFMELIRGRESED